MTLFALGTDSYCIPSEFVEITFLRRKLRYKSRIGARRRLRNG